MPGPQVVIVYNKENAELNSIATTLGKLFRAKSFDSREAPQTCDICIHLAEPYAVWFPWSRSNCILVDIWNSAWNGYKDLFDVAIFNDVVEDEFRFTISFIWKNTSILKDYHMEILQECKESIDRREPVPVVMPPLLTVEDCPAISILTLVHNRPKFIENACLNLLSTDYPHNKIEWVVVDDSESELSPSNRIIQFQQKFAGTVVYCPLVKKTSIGAKRNLAVERAKNGILLMMDDDDHYPTTSFRRRVAYLLKSRRRYECAVCTTIAMYDLQTGISAVNSPPYGLSLGQRCSEATLTFTREFWNKRPFELVDMAEGEKFLEKRESQVVEMPPQQIIVALSHGSNTSRRKSPQGNPGCFWGFPRELLEFLHGLVNVKVEDSSSS